LYLEWWAHESDAHWCFNCYDIIPVCRLDRYPYLGYHLLQEKDTQEHKEQQV
jgi:hypothetical protein